MRSDLTDITLIVDRSGSMTRIHSDAQGGINSFIAEQVTQPNDALLTLVEFDHEYNFVHKGVPISAVPEYRMHPRGSTALLDAVGRAIGETGIRLAHMDETERPGLVIFVVMTDGHENSSREFTKSMVREMITHQQTKYSWQFIFLAADQDAFTAADEMGIAAGGVHGFESRQIEGVFAGSALRVSNMRWMRAAGKSPASNWSDEELAAMKQETLQSECPD